MALTHRFNKTHCVIIQRTGILALLLLLAGAVYCQKIFSGKIVDAASGKPVASASIFLSNTSVGTATDANGTFTIYNFPDGRFDVVISCLGYETYVVTVESVNIPAALTIQLQQKVKQLKEVVIGGTEQLSWNDWGPFFMKNFIGTSSFAEDCKIVNTKAINLRRNKKTGNITASANEQLIIENEALGYRIYYQLEDFEYDRTTNFVFFAGYPLFEPMTTRKEKTRDRWKANRLEAYEGSQMHFLRALYRNKLAEEQFEVRRMTKVVNTEKRRVKNMYRLYAMNDPGKLTDSSAYYNKIMREPDEKSYLHTPLLTGDSIAYATDSTTLFLSFNDYLYIIYKNKKEPAIYLEQTNQQRSPANITSEIRLSEPEIQVFYNGSFYPGTAIVHIGFWGWWEKVGTMLPYDYLPGK